VGTSGTKEGKEPKQRKATVLARAEIGSLEDPPYFVRKEHNREKDILGLKKGSSLENRWGKRGLLS